MRKMKDSGVEWIGEIPEDWEVKRFKNVAMLYTGVSISDTIKDNYMDAVNAIPYISTKDIDAISSHVDYKNGLYTKLNDGTFKTANLGDSLMCIEGGSAGKKKAFVERKVSFVNKLCCFHPNIINGDYLYFFICSPNYEKMFKNNISGLIGGVSVSVLKNIKIALPSFEKQGRIADFLKLRCAKIDTIIAGQQAVIERLKLYKQSVITEAVTKGLDPNVPMKDSGIEWIGKMPEHWLAPKIKYMASITSGGTPDRNRPEYWNGNINWLKTGELKNAEIYGSEEKITEEGLANSSAKIFSENTILMAMYGQGKTRGTTAFLKVPCSTNQACAGIRLVNKAFSTGYLWKCLIGAYDSIRGKAEGSGQPNLSGDLISDFYLPMPPIEEQKDICTYIDCKCSHSDILVLKKQALIDKLTQYKKSLIYEAVTGKMEV